MSCRIFGNIGAVLAGVSVLISVTGCFAQQEERGPLDIETVEAFPGLEFTRPLWLGPAPDGSDRLFLLEQAGRVLWFENRRDVSQDEVKVALDIRDKVRSPGSEESRNKGHNEEGLLGMAFHPDFEENGFVFLHYSETSPEGADDPQRGVVARFEMDRESFEIDPDSEEVILTVGQFRGNHNGGMVDFGPDGYLYVSFGDGGGGGDPEKNGQNLGTLLGTILRIDVDRTEGERPYAIPADNPFVDREGARPEIFAYGLRNVWRFSFDPEHGDLWSGDVCQNTWEKIYLIQKGGNYGWPYLEGSHPHDGIPDDVDPASLTAPIVEHERSDARSITGGYIYRGSSRPELRDAYIYGDFVTGAMFALWYDRAAEKMARHERLGEAPVISSFGLDHEEELYVVSLHGKIYRFAPADAQEATGEGR